MNRRRPISRCRATVSVVAATLVALTLSACGGDAEAEPEVAVPTDCLASWNSENASRSFGRHAYEEHDARRGQLAMLPVARGAVNVKGKETCAMVFAVPESDIEYGEVGLAVTKFGWASMKELARNDPDRLAEIQLEASRGPNVNLFPDGTAEGI